MVRLFGRNFSKKELLVALAAGIILTTAAFNDSSTPLPITPSLLLYSQVTTSGQAVTALAAGSVVNGCWIQNDPMSTTLLVIDNVNVANHSVPTPSTSYLVPGGIWVCPGNSTLPITIDSFENGHKFFGERY